ncbi:MAG: alanine racemase [Patescibacteria group bacterium]
MKNHPETNPELNGLRTWIEIDAKAVAHNYKLLRGLISSVSPKTKFMAVVKSNAYGHGLVDFSKEMEKLGADWLGVDSIVEATALRKAGIKSPILVLGYTLPSRLEEAADENISLTVSTFETLEQIAGLNDGLNDSPNASANIGSNKKLSIHIKVDTGMHRQGFLLADIPRVISKLKSLHGNISVEGLFTHLAAAKNPSFPTKTSAQLEEFGLWQKAFAEADISAGRPLIIHAAASAGAIIYPQSHFNMARFGITVYGLWPSVQVRGFAEEKLPLKPVLSWRTIIGEIKNVKKGESVGYDLVETLERDTTLAVCPVGYWHGLPRAISSVGHVLVRGQRARIVGRVSMDMITIDVTDISGVKIGDAVTLIGRDGNEEIRAQEIAGLSETSDYEIITRINPLIKRIIV